jgi:hypothetical protein
MTASKRLTPERLSVFRSAEAAWQPTNGTCWGELLEHIDAVENELTAKKTMLREKATEWARSYNALSNKTRAVEAEKRKLIEAARDLLKEMDHGDAPSLGVLAKLRAATESLSEPNESTKETH